MSAWPAFNWVRATDGYEMSVTRNDWISVHNCLEFESRQLRDMLELWRSKCTGDRLPSRTDFDLCELKSHVGWLVLVDVERDPQRFLYRLIGSNITGLADRDVTGKYFDELYDAETASAATSSYRRVVGSRRPTRVNASLHHASKGHLTFEAIDLPLSNDGTRVDMILVRCVYDIVKS